MADYFLFFLELILVAVGLGLIIGIKNDDPNKKTYNNIGIAGVVLGGVGFIIHVLFVLMTRRPAPVIM